MLRQSLIAVLLALAATLATAAPPLTTAAIVLLQPDEVIQERVESAKDLARYIKDVEAAAGQSIEVVFQRKPTGGFMVVAVKPGRRAKVWLDLEPPLPSPTANALRGAVESLPAPAVRTGVVVFALKVSLWNGRLPQRGAPAPSEWKAEAARSDSKLEVGALVQRVWPD